MEQGAANGAARRRLLEQALFRGAALTLENPDYVRTLRAITGAFLNVDLAPADLTVEALGIDRAAASAALFARERAVVAGIHEAAYLMRGFGLETALKARDGELVEPGAILLSAAGALSALLSVERVVLNLVQRLSAIATATRALIERAETGAGVRAARIVATRKTPWSLLDKRAVHLGGGGTHRLGLSDAILIKNNHLATLAASEEEAAPIALERAWERRAKAAFIEVEVRAEAAAIAAARAFARLSAKAARPYPCLLMLDNMTAEEAARAVGALKREQLWERVLVEASGRIGEHNVAEYALSGVDAVSVGALTHSARGLDICQRISQGVDFIR